MTPLGQCDRVERLERALMAIEVVAGLACEEGEEGGSRAEAGRGEGGTPEQPYERGQVASTIYSMAHAALGHCQNPHADWLERVERIEAWGKRLRLYDAERELAGVREKREGSCELSSAAFTAQSPSAC